MSINKIYHIWFRKITQLLDGERITRIRNLTWLVVGVFLSKSVQLNKIGLKIPGKAKAVSVSQRLRRFLCNPGFVVRTVYEPIAKDWLKSLAASQGGLLLSIDGTPVGFGHQMIMVSAAYHHRTLPIAWTWVPGRKGNCPAKVYIQLLSYVRTLLPKYKSIKLVGDGGFYDGKLWKILEKWGWQYALRITDRTLMRTSQQEPWQPSRHLLSKAGQRVWLEQIDLTQKHHHSTNLLAHWQRGEKQPWYIATNLPSAQLAFRAYRRRMWIEEMFGDWKRHGFDFESTHVRHPERLSLLTLAVALLYLWLVIDGVRLVKNGEAKQVDRNDRRDLSVFQIGLRWIERCLTTSIPFSISLLIPKWKLSGS